MRTALALVAAFVLAGCGGEETACEVCPGYPSVDGVAEIPADPPRSMRAIHCTCLDATGARSGYVAEWSAGSTAACARAQETWATFAPLVCVGP